MLPRLLLLLCVCVCEYVCEFGSACVDLIVAVTNIMACSWLPHLPPRPRGPFCLWYERDQLVAAKRSLPTRSPPAAPVCWPLYVTLTAFRCCAFFARLLRRAPLLGAFYMQIPLSALFAYAQFFIIYCVFKQITYTPHVRVARVCWSVSMSMCVCVCVLTMWRTHIFLAKITADDGRKLIVKTGEKMLRNLCQMFALSGTLTEAARMAEAGEREAALRSRYT